MKSKRKLLIMILINILLHKINTRKLTSEKFTTARLTLANLLSKIDIAALAEKKDFNDKLKKHVLIGNQLNELSKTFKKYQQKLANYLTSKHKILNGAENFYSRIF